MVSSFFNINSIVRNKYNNKKGFIYSIISENFYHVIYYNGSFEFIDSKDIELLIYRKLSPI